MEDVTLSAPKARARILRIRESMQAVIRGKDEVIDNALICLLCGGHLLLEDLPGLGKTTLAYSLARAIDVEFRRLQFTSDLLPSDVLGVSIYDERLKVFSFKEGPVFTNILLADEINRTTPKTQSALLEVMDRGRVSVDGESHPVGDPFMVIATQNPVDYEGTFPLPESQMDRFLMRLEMGYPDFDTELEILGRDQRGYDAIKADPVLSVEELRELQAGVGKVFIEDSVLHYLLQLATATRTEAEFHAGVSTRGTLAFKAVAQATAYFHGRTFVIPEDVIAAFIPVCAHRLSLRRPSSDVLEERRVIEGLLRKVIDSISRPVV
jgi:MoxR-like ATPase